MSIIDKIRRHGFKGSLRKLLLKIMNKSGYTKWRFRNSPVYANPTENELAIIETDLTQLGVKLYDHAPPLNNSSCFSRKPGFLPIITEDEIRGYGTKSCSNIGLLVSCSV